jgi:hypothetical protein
MMFQHDERVQSAPRRAAMGLESTFGASQARMRAPECLAARLGGTAARQKPDEYADHNRAGYRAERVAFCHGLQFRRERLHLLGRRFRHFAGSVACMRNGSLTSVESVADFGLYGVDSVAR